jgi:hypothetical protein
MKKILEHYKKYKMLRENENKFQKNPEKFSGELGQLLNALLKPFTLNKHQDASA